MRMIDGKVQTEASGNVTQATVAAIAKSDCDFISCGALTHSVTALDISFNVELKLTQRISELIALKRSESEHL